MKNTTQENFWDTLRAGTFIARGADIRKSERARINDLMTQCKNFEEQE